MYILDSFNLYIFQKNKNLHFFIIILLMNIFIICMGLYILCR